MEHRYDIVIIGAGPAGAACAITLRQLGASPCVIDRATFPRAKTCAGLVTGKTSRLIDGLFDGSAPDTLFCSTCGHTRLFRRAELLVDAPLVHAVHCVDRAPFDNALVERYKALGGVMMEGARILSIDYDARSIRLAGGDSVRYDTLLFADGALSLSRRLTGADKSDLAFGIEAYLPAELLPTDSVDLYFDYLDSGYAWVFPHGETVCIGLADRWDKRTDYRGIFEGFLRDLGVSAHSHRLIGAFLPYGKAVDQAQLPDNILLLGDAAGLTDPISGEGLYMAMQSGVTAARSMSAAEPKRAYLQGVRELTDVVRQGAKVQRAFYSAIPHRTFLHKVRGNDRVVSYFFEHMVEEYRYAYRDLPRLLKDYKRNK